MGMERYAIDAPTSVHVVDEDLFIHPRYQLIAFLRPSIARGPQGACQLRPSYARSS